MELEQRRGINGHSRHISKAKSLCSSEEEGTGSRHKTPPPFLNPIEQTDSGIRQYVAILKKRGHKRTASAPVPSSPPMRSGGRDWVFDGQRGTGDGGMSSNVSNSPSNVRYNDLYKMTF